jgi:hypothetical protein
MGTAFSVNRSGCEVSCYAEEIRSSKRRGTPEAYAKKSVRTESRRADTETRSATGRFASRRETIRGSGDTTVFAIISFTGSIGFAAGRRDPLPILLVRRIP